MNKEKELLTTQELAAKFKRCRQTIIQYKKEGMPVATEKPLMFHYEDCYEWLKQRKRKVRK